MPDHSINLKRIEECLLRLIDFNTTRDTGDSRPCAEWIAKELQKNHIHACTVPGSSGAVHVFAEIPGTAVEYVLLHAHLDTAEYQKERNWLFPPDRGTIRRGCICGRGALDCKSQIAVWMQLMIDRMSQELNPSNPPEYFNENNDQDGNKQNSGWNPPHPKKSIGLKLLITDKEETGGREGLASLLLAHPEILDRVRLVIGEGGGFPFPDGDCLYYTFQTGEREDMPREENADAEITLSETDVRNTDIAVGPDVTEVKNTDTAVSMDVPEDKNAAATWDAAREALSAGIAKGYYREDLLRYCREHGRFSDPEHCINTDGTDLSGDFENAASSENSERAGKSDHFESFENYNAQSLNQINERQQQGRVLDPYPLYAGMETWFAGAPPCTVYHAYGPWIEDCLKAALPNARLMPVITPGYSDNRWFRRAGIPTLGFFPLDRRNALSGIHGVNEYISRASLRLSYEVMTQVVEAICRSL